MFTVKHLTAILFRGSERDCVLFLLDLAGNAPVAELAARGYRISSTPHVA